jgi:hypothetical protein
MQVERKRPNKSKFLKVAVLLANLIVLYLALSIPVFFLYAKNSIFLAVSFFLLLKVSSWFLWLRTYDKADALLVASLSLLFFSILFIAIETQIRTIGMNVILLGVAFIFCLESLGASGLGVTKNRKGQFIIASITSLVGIIYIVFRFKYGDVPFGYGP